MQRTCSARGRMVCKMLDDVGSDYPWSGRDTGQLLGVHPQEFARVIKQITNLQLDASNRQSRPLLPSL